MRQQAETSSWERQWAVRFGDGTTTVPQVHPGSPQLILESYRRTAPGLACELVSRLVTSWEPARLHDEAVSLR